MLFSARSLRRSLAATLTTTAAFLSLTASHAQAGIVQPWVHVQGTGFADQHGNAVTLRGVNVAGSAGLRTAALIKSTGANMVRIFMPWSEAEPTAPTGGVHHWSRTYLAKTDALVKAFQADGINVLIDMHQMDLSPYFGGRGVPAWYYTDTKHGQFARTKAGLKAAQAAWWTDAAGEALYANYARMLATRYSAYPNVVGFEVFNEPFTGNLKGQAATKAVIAWTAQIRSAIRRIAPSRAIFMQTLTGGDLGLLHADFSPFGDLKNVVIDYHDYYNGSAGAGWSADQFGWVPSWDATHNQTSLHYHGTQAALDANLAPLVRRAHALGVPLFVGEWGAQTADKGVITYQHHMLSVLAKYGVSWTRWDIRGDRWAIADANYRLNAAGRDLASYLHGR